MTGIALPIAFSFCLKALTNATPLQAFAAGAALCSTSLGTTFTVLSTSNLATSRLGTVLTTAAMLDDVVGLIMVQIISNLGDSAVSLSAVTIVRPIAVSVGLTVSLFLVCGFVVKPLTSWSNTKRQADPDNKFHCLCASKTTAFTVHTLILVGLMTAATYGGTSNLFAAYLAGASISWWNNEVQHVTVPLSAFTTEMNQGRTSSEPKMDTNAGNQSAPVPSEDTSPKQPASDSSQRSPDSSKSVAADDRALSGVLIFEQYYAAATQRILKPFFFASVGFAIPITQMFKGPIVWRGIIYTSLMLLAKLLTGLWLIRFSTPAIRMPTLLGSSKNIWQCWPAAKKSRSAANDTKSEMAVVSDGKVTSRKRSKPRLHSVLCGTQREQEPQHGTNATLSKPLSLYPAAILGGAMVARGEIGFLIVSIAESKGIFTSSSSLRGSASDSSEIFLTAVWAITLCTVLGPITVGTLVRRVRKLQTQASERSAGAQPLGIWGLD